MPIIWRLHERPGAIPVALTVADAERLLADWRSVVDDRDKVVIIAWRSGMSKMDIHRLTGLSRDTVAAIIAAAP